MYRKTAVIGLGNTLRRDDGIGIRILESLLNFFNPSQKSPPPAAGGDEWNCVFSAQEEAADFSPRSFTREDIDYLDFGSASFDLLNRIRDYEKVILIDGIDAELEPGQLKIFRLDEIEYALGGPAISSHELNLKGVFELYKSLGLKTEVYVAGVQVKDVSFGEGLSGELERKLGGIVEEIDRFIRGL